MRIIIMKVILLFFFFFITNYVNGQELQFKISNTYINPFGLNTDLVGFIPLFKLDSDSIDNKQNSAKIRRLPKTINRLKTAYCFLRFAGVKNSIFKNELTLLVENYQTDSPTIYIDRNGNLDFTDDGEHLKLNKDLILRLANSDNNSAIYHYRIARSQITIANEERIKNRYASKYPKSRIISPIYWLTKQRHSVRASKGKIGENPITILLQDNSIDGLFTFQTDEMGDRIILIEGEIGKDIDITSYLRQGEPIDHNAIFELYGKKYCVIFFSKSGESLSITETNKDTRIIFKEDIDVSSFEIELLTGESLRIENLIKEKKYLLVDVGGTWCGGCINQEPTIKKLYKDGKVEVIGVFDHDTPESVANYIKKHEIEWSVALVNSTFKEMFRINSYPTYILISPEGKIVLIDQNSEQIAKYLSK
jgi:thiol-disulfide isomerase/thioredoxin